jgi:hypothetical protein
VVKPELQELIKLLAEIAVEDYLSQNHCGTESESDPSVQDENKPQQP